MKCYQLFVPLFLASGGFAAPTPASPRSFKVPIAKRGLVSRGNNEIDGTFFLKSLDKSLKKYGHAGLSLPSGIDVSSLSKRDGSTEGLYDQYYSAGLDELYWGDFSIRDLTFTCDFDTGSSDLFVPGVNCTVDEGCLDGERYDSGGTNLGNTTEVTYGSGAIEGDNWLDDVTIGGITATNQNVIVLNTAEGFNTSASDALCGMGFNNIANSGKPTFFSTMVTQGSVDADEFSFYFGRGADGTGNCSELILGGRDETKINGSLTTVPVSEEGYWQTDLDAVEIDGEALDTNVTAGQAIHDTGTTVVIAPVAASKLIASTLNGYTISVDGEVLIAYPCNSQKSVDFVLAGTAFSISSTDLNVGEITPTFASLIGSEELTNIVNSPALPGYCLLGIIGADLLSSGSYYILGDTFLKNRYSVFSYSASDGSPAVLFGNSVDDVTC